MDDYTEIAGLQELRNGKGIVRKLDDDEVALVMIDGSVHAFINVCPHQHTPLVDSYGGQIAGSNLTCPMHGWTYDLTTGKCINESGRLKMLTVKIEKEKILVKKKEEKSTW